MSIRENKFLKDRLTINRGLNVDECNDIVDRGNKHKSIVLKLDQMKHEMPTVYGRILDEFAVGLLLDVTGREVLGKTKRRIIVLPRAHIKRIWEGMDYILNDLFAESSAYLQEEESLLIFLKRFETFKPKWKNIGAQSRAKSYIDAGNLLENTISEMTHEIWGLFESGCVRKGQETDYLESFLDWLNLRS